MGQTAEAVNTIGRDELKRKIDRREPIVLLETLSPEHFQHVHLPGARKAPLAASGSWRRRSFPTRRPR